MAFNYLLLNVYHPFILVHIFRSVMSKVQNQEKEVDFRTLFDAVSH